MRTIKYIHTYFMQLSAVKFVICISVLSYLVVIPYVAILSFFIDDMGSPEVLNSDSILEIIFLSLVFAPIVETFIYQTLIIRGLRIFTWFKRRPLIIALISAILFGVSHEYSLYYMFFAFLIGLLLAYSYLMYLYRKESSFIVTAAIHFIRNSAMTLMLLAERTN